MVNRDKELVTYYTQRAYDYEQVYAKPERQADLAQLRALVRGFTDGERVLEIPCGTGYWTAVMAPGAASIHAVDISREVLTLAAAKQGLGSNVTFEVGDAMTARYASGAFSAVVSGFWLSHIPSRRLRSFIAEFCAGFGPGTKLLFFDNRYVPGSSTPIGEPDADGDTFQQRRLADGTPFTVLKNFFSENDLTAIATSVSQDVRVRMLTYYWILQIVVGED
jgi:demethylmenaquinone methyltransferase/2-methoxy-6-polyprenyl-1,4-benzoquinol methylase